MTSYIDVNAAPRIALVSTHGYVAAQPPLGAADTGGQVVYVIELAKKLAQLGHKVDIYTRRFEDQPEIDEVDADVRVIRIPCGGPDFIPKEYLHRHLNEWNEKALRYIKREGLSYLFVNSHYWTPASPDSGSPRRSTFRISTRRIRSACGRSGRWRPTIRSAPTGSRRNSTSRNASSTS
jgi:hypothetical protein